MTLAVGEWWAYVPAALNRMVGGVQSWRKRGDKAKRPWRCQESNPGRPARVPSVDYSDGAFPLVSTTAVCLSSGPAVHSICPSLLHLFGDSGHYEIHRITNCVLNHLRASEGPLCFIRLVQNQGRWRNLTAQLAKRELNLGHALSCSQASYYLPNIGMVKS
jgi:hypothetical protein